ncbi:hypothetical protein [Priestia endophytica]|uniref:hypothetical protein n=1 Tax=Priestia endophytica TaxID=135735 RepID=UPI00227FFE5F|nr:hypothetical protein [Priestia endophytica]MCY8230630.1 hypothetical protein [Priestia endophytica]
MKKMVVKVAASLFILSWTMVAPIVYETMSHHTLAAGDIKGKWENTQSGTMMELTPSGQLLRSGVKVGKYQIVSATELQLSTEAGVRTVKYELEGNTLKWGKHLEETFKRAQ